MASPRFKVLLIPQPSPEHFGAIAERVLQELASRWKVDPRVLPRLPDLDLPQTLRSARQVRLATDAAVVAHVRHLVPH